MLHECTHQIIHEEVKGNFLALEGTVGYLNTSGPLSTSLWAIPAFINARAQIPLLIFELYAGAGLGGIEAYYSEYGPEQRSHLVGICETLGIVGDDRRQGGARHRRLGGRAATGRPGRAADDDAGPRHRPDPRLRPHRPLHADLREHLLAAHGDRSITAAHVGCMVTTTVLYVRGLIVMTGITRRCITTFNCCLYSSKNWCPYPVIAVTHRTGASMLDVNVRHEVGQVAK